MAQSYGVAKLADDFADALREELDFRHEASHVESVAAALKPFPSPHVPVVVARHTTPRVLVMERLRGQPLSNLGSELAEFGQREITTLAPLLRPLPRHVDRVASQLQRGMLTTRVSLFSNPADVRVLERLLNKALLTVLGLGAVGLSILLIGTQTGPLFAERDLT